MRFLLSLSALLIGLSAAAQVPCLDPLACNFNPAATGDDGSCAHCFCGPGTYWDEALGQCRVANAADLNFDGCTTVADLVVLLGVFGQCAE